MGPQPRNADRIIARIARRQHGNATRRQLLVAGVTRKEIKGRVARGALIAVHRGVYRVAGAGPSLEADYMAAVLACGDGACLSGLAAARLWEIVKGSPPPQVTAPTERKVKGVVTHRASPKATTRKGIPLTTVPATLVALAAVLPEDALARACHEAGVKYGTTPRQVEAVMPGNASGSAALRRILRGDTRVTLSKLEQRFLQLLRDNNLPLPQTNKVRGSKRVDCHWPGLTVELDGYRFHNSRHSWKQDRIREREARARGDEFRRYGWDDLPEPALRELGQLLPRGAPRATT